MTSTADPTRVEYLYRTATYEDFDGALVTEVVPLRITKKTPKRIYYLRDERRGRVGYVDRQEMEATGEAFYSNGTASFFIYAQPPDLSRSEPRDAQAELSRLKTEMAAAHPDRGGSDEEFIAAHRRYRQALRH